jgi:hypothetical protein
MTFRAHYKTAYRPCFKAKTKAGVLSMANLRLLKTTALQSPSDALRKAWLRLATHQEQLNLWPEKH